MNTTIGTCGRCGGRVSVPSNWMATIPAVPTCESCGAKKANPHGPVVEMEPVRREIKYIAPEGFEHLTDNRP